VYISETWCKNISVKSKLCNPNIELLSLSLIPFYLPGEIASINLFVVYIPPSGNYLQACETLKNTVDERENEAPNATNILLRDFNNCPVHRHLHGYTQYVKCTTRFQNTR